MFLQFVWYGWNKAYPVLLCWLKMSSHCCTTYIAARVVLLFQFLLSMYATTALLLVLPSLKPATLYLQSIYLYCSYIQSCLVTDFVSYVVTLLECLAVVKPSSIHTYIRHRSVFLWLPQCSTKHIGNSNVVLDCLGDLWESSYNSRPFMTLEWQCCW